MSRIDRLGPWIQIGAGTLTAMLSIDSTMLRPIRVFQIVIGLMIVAMGGYILGMRRSTAAFKRVLGTIPNAVTFERQDDGRLHAFVTLINGDLRVIEVPAEVADSPVAATSYVLEALREGDE